MQEEFDVLIVGGGMVGAAVACALGDSSLSVALVEQTMPEAFSSDQPHDMRVSALSIASKKILETVGAWDAVISMRSCPFKRMRVWETAGDTEFNSDTIDYEALGYIVENRVTQLALLQRAQTFSNVTLLCPAVIKQIAYEQGKGCVTLDDGRVLTAKVMVGADGGQSRVRQTVGLGVTSWDYQQQAMVINVETDYEQQDITWQSFTTHGPLAFLPLPDIDGKHYASLVWYDFPTQLERLLAQDNDTLLATLQTSYPADLPPLESVIAKAKFPLFKSHAKHYVMEGLALAGDAAHTINPLAGQGVNLGFMDAAVLIETIAQAVLNDEDFSSLAVLRRYEKKRRSENQSMMSLMDAFYYGFSSKHLPARVARNLGLGVAQRLGFAKNKVMQYAIGVSGDLPRLAKPI